MMRMDEKKEDNNRNLEEEKTFNCTQRGTHTKIEKLNWLIFIKYRIIGRQAKIKSGYPHNQLNHLIILINSLMIVMIIIDNKIALSIQTDNYFWNEIY